MASFLCLRVSTTQLAHKAKSNNYYYPTVDIKAVDGTGDINADTIKYKEIIGLFDGLVNKYPNYVSKQNLGKDTSGLYDVFGYNFIQNVPGDYIVLDGNVHGNSSDGDPKDVSVALYYFLRDLCQNTDKNDKLADLRTKVNLSVIPVGNPWGYDNDMRTNVNGVDLNRNWSWNWKPGLINGSAPFSEKETQIIRDNLLGVQYQTRSSNHKVLSYISLHSLGNKGIVPQFFYSVSSTNPLRTVFRNVSKYLSEKYGYTNREGVGAASVSSADNYAERILGIPSGTSEFGVYRNDGHVRSAYSMKQQVEFFGNLIYQSLNLSITSKLKLSLLELGPQITVPQGTSTLKVFSSLYGENYFEYDAATGEVTIPLSVEYVKLKAQISLVSTSSTAENVPIGVYIYKNGVGYQGLAANESVAIMGGNGLEKYYTVQVQTPAVHCVPGDKFTLQVYNGKSNGIMTTSSNPRTTWLSVEEVGREK